MSALEELRRHYQDRTAAARAAKAASRKVVGLVGTTVPVELVMAAGAYPLNVAPMPGTPTREADRYLERHFDDDVRATLESLLAGAYDWLNLLVIPRTSDGYLELYYTLKEVVRLGQVRRVPPLHLYDLLHARSEANRAYGLERTHELRSRLTAAMGVEATRDRLREAASEVNAQRRAVRHLLELRRDPANGVSGVDALTAIGAGRFLEPDAHRELVERYVGEERPPLDPRPRLLVVAGVPLTDLRLHRLLEDAAGLVVAEDDAWGSRFAGADVRVDAADPLEGIFEKYFLDVPSPRVAPAAARDEWLRSELARGDIDGVVFYVPRSDTWFGWDYPRLKGYVEAAGLPSVLLRELDPEAVAGLLRQGTGAR